MTHTRLVQMPCDDLRRAGEIFSRQSSETCVLVLVPRTRLFPWLRIPSEAQVVMQKWGADIEALAAGFQFLPPWYRVAYLVTKQSCNYNAPIKEAPTSDNVKIEVDVHFNFMITDARNFVYQLGAVRFDELLHAAAEEAIRIMVRATPIDRVYELRGSQAGELLSVVNTKFEPFGVTFSQANITNVKIPDDLQRSLQQATLYHSKLSEQQKSHIFRMDRLRKDAEKSQIDTNNQNTLAINDMNARLRRLELTHEDQIMKAKTESEIAITRAKENSWKAVKQAETDLYRAKAHAEEQYNVRREQATAKAQADKVEAEQKAREMVTWSEAELQASRDEAKAKLAEAESEEKAAVNFREMREFELESTRLSLLREMAQKNKLVFTGDNADVILQSLLASASLDAASQPKAKK